MDPRAGDVMRTSFGIEYRCIEARKSGIYVKYAQYNQQRVVRTSRRWWRQVAKNAEVLHAAR